MFSLAIGPHWLLNKHINCQMQFVIPCIVHQYEVYMHMQYHHSNHNF